MQTMSSTPTKRHSFGYGTPLNRNSMGIPSPIKTSPSQKLHNSNIKVIGRFRPQSDDEVRKYGKDVTEFYNDGKSVSIHTKEFSNNFTFDRVFGPESSQLDIYNYSIRETISDFFKGYNGTILAYGQSGSGKSFTMTGGIHLDGIIPRLITDIFSSISQLLSEIEYIVGVSYMEIYMEQIRDLLDETIESSTPHSPRQQHQHQQKPIPSKYTIHEDKENGVYVKGLKRAFVSSATELLSILKRGDRMRAIGSTNLNVESSRSHTIFQIKLTQKLVEDGTIKNSNLFLVDLAGSEKVMKTGAIGHTLEEAKKINSSLSALGNVIYTLAEGKSSHVPYRDSKLTRILQESLGGNSRTSLIITCSPSSVNEQETLSTLRFGSSAKKIKNNAHINTELSSQAMKLKIDTLEKINEQNKIYIAELERELRRNGGSRVGETITEVDPNVSISPSINFSSLSMSTTKTPTRIPRLVTGNSANANNIQITSISNDSDIEVHRRDKKIEELEAVILELKMEKLKVTHEEDLKLFKLEKIFVSFSDKLNELERANSLLTEDIESSTKIIEARNERITKLENILRDQQVQMLKESLNIDTKLGYIKEKLKQQQQQFLQNTPSNTGEGATFNNRPLLALFTHEVSFGDINGGSPIIGNHSPSSPKVGINLRIVKPMRGGDTMQDMEEET